MAGIPKDQGLIREVQLLISARGAEKAARRLSIVSSVTNTLIKTINLAQKSVNTFYGTLGAGSISIKDGVKAIDDYNRQLIKLRALYTTSGTGFGTARAEIEKMSSTYHFLRKDVIDFATAFRNSFGVATRSVSQATNVMAALSKIVGKDTQSIKEMYQVLSSVVDKAGAFRNVMLYGFDKKGNVTGAGKLASEITAMLGLSSGTLNASQADSLFALASGGKGRQGDEGLQKAKDSIEAINSAKEQVERINVNIGSQLMPHIIALERSLDAFVQAHAGMLASGAIGAELTKGALGGVSGILSTIGLGMFIRSSAKAGARAGAGVGAAGLGGAGAAAEVGAGGAAVAGGSLIGGLASAAAITAVTTVVLGILGIEGYAVFKELSALSKEKNEVKKGADVAYDLASKRKHNALQVKGLYGEYQQAGADVSLADAKLSRELSKRNIFGFGNSANIKQARRELYAAKKERSRIHGIVLTPEGNKEYEKEREQQSKMVDEDIKRAAALEKIKKTFGEIYNEQQVLLAMNQSMTKLMESQVSLATALVTQYSQAAMIGPKGIALTSAAVEKAQSSLLAQRNIAEQTLKRTEQLKGISLQTLLTGINNDKDSKSAIAKLYGSNNFSKDISNASSDVQISMLNNVFKSKSTDELHAMGLSDEEIASIKTYATISQRLVDQTTAEVDLKRQLVEYGDKMVQTDNQRLKFAEGALSLKQSELNVTQAQISLATNLAMGVGPSAELRMAAVRKMQEQIQINKKVLVAIDVGERDAAKTYKETGDKTTYQREMVNFATQRKNIEAEIVQKQVQQAQMLRQIRDGYISAIAAMTTGAGVFTKILYTQNENTGTLMRSVGAVPTAIRTGANIGGYRQSERYGPGFIGTNAERRHQAFRTDTPSTYLFGNNLEQNAALGMDVMQENMNTVFADAVSFGANKLQQGEYTEPISEGLIKGIKKAVDNVNISGLGERYANSVLSPANTGRATGGLFFSNEQITNMKKSMVEVFEEVISEASDKIKKDLANSS